MSELLLRPLQFATITLCAAAMVIACSGSDTSTSSGAAGTDPDASTASDPDASTDTPDSSAPFALTSAELAEGATFSVDNTCTGKNVSPSLSWGPGPEGTKSYAVVLNDTTIKFLHAITYDIPASETSLPAKLEATYALTKPAGAHTTQNYLGDFGYAGPCPGTLHVYELVLYALDVATLPGVTQNVSLADAEKAIKAHSLGSTRLTGKYKKP